MERMVGAVWTPRCCPRRPAGTANPHATITCRACGATVVVTLSNEVLLCKVCQTRPDQAHATLEQRTFVAWQTFLGVIALATSTDAERYARVWRARWRLCDRPDDAAFRQSVTQRLLQAHAIGDGLSVILAAEMRLHEQLRAVAYARDELAWLTELRTSV